MRKSNFKMMVLFFMAGFVGSATAQTVLSAAGKQDPLDNMGGTARALGMGSAFAGVANDESAILWNPAGLSSLESPGLSLNHSSWLAQTFQEELLLGMPLPGGGLGLSTHYVGYGSFDGRDANGFPVSSYSADQIGMGLGWGQKILGGLSGGLAVHGNQQTLAGTSSTLIGMDLGLMFKTGMGWNFGASYENLGLGSTSQALSSAVRLGASKLWKDRSGTSFMAALGGDIAPGEANSIQAGAEFSYHSVLFLRAGYNLQLQDTGFGGVQGLTGGAGIQWGTLKLDYAFVPYGELGNVNLVSLGYSFGAPVASQRSVAPAVIPAKAPVTVVAQPAVPSQPQGYVVPQPLPDNGPKTPERTITMEFEVPTDQGIVQAKALAQQGKVTDAILALKSIIDKDPKNATAWRELGNIYFATGRKDYAIQCFDTYLKLKPDDRALSDWLERYKETTP